MEIGSPAFDDQERIPRRYTCDGEDISPALVIEDVPEDAVELALVVDDPDAPAGTFVHWVVWGMPAGGGQIPEGASGSGDFLEGRNDFGRRGWGGPCPPDGLHHYRFRVYAVQRPLKLQEGAGADELEEALDGDVVAEARLVGTYPR